MSDPASPFINTYVQVHRKTLQWRSERQVYGRLEVIREGDFHPWQVHFIHVAPAYRRQGIALHLLEQVPGLLPGPEEFQCEEFKSLWKKYLGAEVAAQSMEFVRKFIDDTVEPECCELIEQHFWELV